MGWAGEVNWTSKQELKRLGSGVGIIDQTEKR